MERCPVCDEKIKDPIPSFCHLCNWDLEEDPYIHSTPHGLIDEELERYKERVAREKKKWRELQRLKDVEERLQKLEEERERKREDPLYEKYRNIDLDFHEGGRYIGSFKEGKMDGHGTYLWVDGERYVGEFKEGRRDGHGTYTWLSGAFYVGEFKEGRRDSHGSYVWLNGNRYVGEWREDRKSVV